MSIEKAIEKTEEKTEVKLESPEDIINKALGGTETLSDTIKVLNDLMNLEKNIEGKSDLPTKDIMRLTKMSVFREIIKPYSEESASNTDKYMIYYMKLRVSNKRLGRTEIIRAIASSIVSETKDRVVSKFFH